MKKQLVLPEFKNEDEEHEFWSKLDLSEYFEAKDMKRFVLEDFMKEHAKKPSTKRITIRIPSTWIQKAKQKAGQLDIPYQSLLKQYIGKGLQVE